MRVKNIIFAVLTLGLYCGVSVLPLGCAQISSPSGGARDTTAPVLLKATPAAGTTNFRGNTIVLQFNEYIEIKDIQQNVLVSPYQRTNPSINYNFRTVTVRFRDTLQPNTTYSVAFGRSIRDLNEGNPFNEYVYAFSTGSTIDSLSLRGKVVLAETGMTDSTLQVFLYRNTTDTAVLHERPAYIARVKGDGTFEVNNLPNDRFRIYALKDGDGGKTYNSKSELFAFTDSVYTPASSPASINLFAYEEVKSEPLKTITKANTEKRLRYGTNLNGQPLDLLGDLELTFNHPIKIFDSTAVLLADTANKKVKATIKLDSTRQVLQVSSNWIAGNPYHLILAKNAFIDSAGYSLLRSDTVFFTVKNNQDYGAVALRFSSLNLAKHPVLQFISTGKTIASYPLTSPQWSNKLFPPGEYELRIFYDDNNNGKWDPGNFSEKRQPEKAITLPKKISIRANWDNESDISL